MLSTSMLRKCASLLILVLSCKSAIAQNKDLKNMQIIYKITTPELWKQSADTDKLVVTSFDSPFIHFAEADNVDRIIAKFFKGQSSVIVLEINPTLLVGRLVKEKNPGGEQEYYHLYNGYIPKSAIMNVVFRDLKTEL